MADKWITDTEMRILIERDKAKPLIKSDVIIRTDGKPHGHCPVCDTPIIFTTFNFCPCCGQRIDQTAWAL